VINKLHVNQKIYDWYSIPQNRFSPFESKGNQSTQTVMRFQSTFHCVSTLHVSTCILTWFHSKLTVNWYTQNNYEADINKHKIKNILTISSPVKTSNFIAFIRPDGTLCSVVRPWSFMELGNLALHIKFQAAYSFEKY
jgi:hypothetical protein